MGDAPFPGHGWSYGRDWHIGRRFGDSRGSGRFYRVGKFLSDGRSAELMQLSAKVFLVGESMDRHRRG